MQVQSMGNLPLTALQQIEAAALQLLSAVRAVQGSGNSHPVSLPNASAVTLTELCNEFLLAKARAGRSDSYLALLLKQLRAFHTGQETLPAALVTASAIEKWLYANQWSDKTRKNAVLTLRTLFKFAADRGYVVGNPALAVDLPTVESEPPGIHSPDHVRAVLFKCPDVSTQRFLAVRYFAGLRASEAAALDESEIRANLIEVTAAKAKTRRRRLVEIQPNLRAWLDYTHQRGGKLPLHQVNNKVSAAVKCAGVPWPKNVPRHSFCSYHLARFESASKTALAAGHTEEMLFGTYRELTTLDAQLVTPELAREFWGIVPGCQDSGQ